MKLNARTAYFVISLIALICGAAIYPLFRGSDLLVWKVLPMPGFWEMLWIDWDKSNGFLSVLVYSAPDFLWLLSGICLLRAVWLLEQKTQNLYILGLYIIAAGYNAGQFLGIIPGTFCYIDLLTMMSVALTEGIIYRVFINKEIKT